MSKTYKVVHQEIDGSVVDRERAWPTIYVEMHPLGTELELSKQGRELHMTIGVSKTVLDKAGIEALHEFTKVIPQ